MLSSLKRPARFRQPAMLNGRWAALAPIGKQERITEALQAMSYWLARLSDCLQPLHQRILIACPQNSHTGLKAWAELSDFPAANILSYPEGSGEMEQLAACVRARPPSGPVLLVNAGCILGASFSAARLLQLAIVRDRDVLCFAPTQNVADLLSQGCPVKAMEAGVCPQLALGREASSSNCSSVPIYVLTQSTARAAGASQAATLEQLLTERAATHPVYGLEVPEVWTPEAWGAQQAALHSTLSKTQQPTQGQQLPQRFTDAGLWEYEVKPEHPAYSTSSNAWGRKPPSQHTLPPLWAGIEGDLNSMGSGEGNTGLRTAKRRSKVHSSLDH